MVTYKTPGVYVEEIAKLPPSVAPVDTAIPAFIGYTEKAIDVAADDLLNKPKRIESLPDFRRYFGAAQPEAKFTVAIEETTDTSSGEPAIKANATLKQSDRSKHILYYAMQHFYENGGKTCYVVSVGKFEAIGTKLDVDKFTKGLDLLLKVDEPTLIVIPEAQSLTIAQFKKVQDAALKQCRDLRDRFVIMDVHAKDKSLSDADTILKDAIDAFRNGGISNDNLDYGAAYAPNLETLLEYSFDEALTTASHSRNGTAVAGTPTTVDKLKGTHDEFYQRALAAVRAVPVTLPPSPAMAGIYARVDADRGVWKAPANVSVLGAQSTIEFSSNDQDHMNVDPVAGKSVNAIRPFVGKGTLVWGGRTLAGNNNEWRYVNVRRFFIFVEESVKKATEPFTFEPNDANTWVKVQAMIENFLTTQWRAGALQGIKPEHAFYVAVGLGKTMTPLDILEGRMIVEIGMAAVRPAEFIILRFSHKMAES